ncbi:MAG: flagellar assembly protein FliW [Actinomycetes bacterium]
MTPSPLATLPPPAPGRVPAPIQALALAEPLPGFPGHRNFVLVPAEPSGRLFWLQSVAPEGPRFLAVPAASYFPDYAPAVPPAACADLGLEDAAQADVYCLVTVPAGEIDAATANLRAPVVVNRLPCRARQVVLADGRHPIRRPLRR